MLIDKDGNTTIITQEKVSVVELVKKLNILYDGFKNDNLVINLTSLNEISIQNVIDFLQISNTHRTAKHSFVIVTDKIKLDEVPDELVIVPTLTEAMDIIEMEEIERDLGF